MMNVIIRDRTRDLRHRDTQRIRLWEGGNGAQTSPGPLRIVHSHQKLQERGRDSPSESPEGTSPADSLVSGIHLQPA